LATTKFSCKVHSNVFGIDRGSGTLAGKPLSEPLDRKSLAAKISTVKCVTVMVTQEKCVTDMVTQEYVTRFAMQAAEATNALAVVGR
jgi:hypothetical protein